MIMTEEEMDEQIAMYEAEEAKRLKQCKCGGEAKVTYIGTYGGTYYEVECKKCGRTTAVCGSEGKAIEEWNAKVADLGGKKTRPVTESDCYIKDSGERREFETGAVRDMAEGKGLMVVMPASALLRLSRHYEHGAKKYGKFNWQKGIPVSSFIDSALRHIMKYLDGWDDEDHLAAAAFNILGAMEMEAHKPAMQDVPAREGTVSFNYKEYPNN